MTSEYSEFLACKAVGVQPSGFEVDPGEIHPFLFGFQRDVVRWAAAKGRAAVLLDTGLGKTFIQLEWARLSGERSLIVAPLSVARQTVREAGKIGLEVHYTRDGSDLVDGVNITNYEMVVEFDPADFGAVVLDESSILKALNGKTRKRLAQMFSDTPYRLCCTATPAPNDYTELGNHAEFLGICTTAEMLSMFFVNANRQEVFRVGDRVVERKGSNRNGQEWRLKHHAEDAFFQWLASWAITMTKPSDLGYSDDGFILPPLSVEPIFIDSDYRPSDSLFFTGLKGLADRADVRRQSTSKRMAECVRIIAEGYNLTEAMACRSKIQKSDGSTCESTTCATENNSSQSSKPSEISSPPRSENTSGKPDMNGTCAIVSGLVPICRSTTSRIGTGLSLAAKSIETPTPMPCETARSSDDTGSSYENTIAFSINRMANAPSAERPTTKPNADCSSITATPVELSGAFSVQHATADSARLTTTLDAFKQLSTTSLATLDKWVVWCGLDEEQELLAEAFGPLCVSVSGKLSIEEKVRLEELWREGYVPIMLTKPRIFGFGVNWQCSHHMAFFGMNDSWETYYQCIRRQWRYGQGEGVKVHLLLSDVEEEIYRNVMRKDALASRLRTKLIEQVREYERGELGMTVPLEQPYEERNWTGEGWRLLLGDACERMGEIQTDSIDLSVYSPPFADLFTYSASPRDLGNSKNWPEFFAHYAFIIREALRVTKPGRLTCVHTSDIPAMASRDGWIGIKDFPGEVVRAYEREGWTFVGRAFVQKNPQAQAIRIHAKGLALVQLRRDSADCRPCLIDQILLFKAPGDNAVPVAPVENGEIDNETWIEWANGIWLGINETETLSYQAARDASDEKHICPLQLGTIERCIKLYSNPGELVLSPFAGIGSEGYMALKLGRRFVGIELKPSYANTAARNLEDAEHLAHRPTLFDLDTEKEA